LMKEKDLSIKLAIISVFYLKASIVVSREPAQSPMRRERKHGRTTREMASPPSGQIRVC